MLFYLLQPSALISKVRSCKTLEDDTDYRLKIVNENDLCLSDADTLRSSLKGTYNSCILHLFFLKIIFNFFFVIFCLYVFICLCFIFWCS